MNKITKRIWSLILTIVMCLSFCTFAYAEDETANTVEVNKEAVNLLSYLGIIDSGIDFEKGLTRAEFTKMVLALADMEIGTYDYTRFYDIYPGTQQANVVMTAAEAKIVRGGDNGMFSPEKSITYAEAATMIIRALGYEELAGMKYAGDLDACVKYARYIGILKADPSKTVTVSNAVDLLFNALNSGYVDMTGAVPVDTAVYEVTDRLYLEGVFGLKRYTGVVTGTEYSKEVGGETGYEGKIEIDNVEYTAEIGNEYDQTEILGKRVYWYLEEEEEFKKVVVVGEMENRNTTVKILPDDIISGNNSTVRYWDKNDKEVTAKLSKNALIYYNDVLSLNIVPEDFDVSDGEIVLVDNNNDKAYDYVFIRKYERYVIGRSSYGVITSYYDNWRFNTKENPNWKIYHDGIEITSDHISQWDEVKVLASKDGKSGIIEVNRNTFEGEVTNIKTKDGKTYITVNNPYTGSREFELEKYYIQAYEANRTGVPKPQKNVSYTFVYNDEGRVYGASSTNSQKYSYGFLIKTVNEGGLNADYQCKIFGEFGSMKVYDLADNFKINGKKYEGEAIMTELSKNDKDGQMVMYRTNDSGELVEILTYVDTTNGGTTFGRDDNNFSLDAQAAAKNWTGTDWRYDVTVNGKTYRVPPTTEVPFFYIPADRMDDEAYKYYSLQSSGSVINTAKAYSATDRCEVFDTIRYDESIEFSKISCIAVYAAAKQLSPVNPYTISSVNSGSGQVGAFCIVRGVEQVIDAYGDVRWQLSYTPVSENKINTAYFADTVYNVDTTSMFGFGDYTVEDLEEGAVIFFNYANPYATVQLIDKFYVAASPARYKQLDYIKMNYNRGEYDMPVSHMGTYWAYGNVIYYDDDELLFETYDDFWITGGGKRYITYRMNTNSVWQYNIKSGEITKSNMAAITRGDRLCMYGSGTISSSGTIIRIVEE